MIRNFILALAAWLMWSNVAPAQDLSLKINPSATGTAATGQIPGTATNDDAAAGNVGELVTATLACASPVSLTTNIAANVTSISLSPGDWDVTGVTVFIPGTTSSVTAWVTSISTTSGTLSSNPAASANMTMAAQVPVGQSNFILPTVRMSVGTTTAVYLVSRSTFTISTMVACGTIRARRVR